MILWFGVDESAKIFLVALGTLFPIYINTWHGIRNIDPVGGDSASLWIIRQPAVSIPCDPPGALPSIMVGMHSVSGLMWLTLIAVAETISAIQALVIWR